MCVIVTQLTSVTSSSPLLGGRATKMKLLLELIGMSTSWVWQDHLIHASVHLPIQVTGSRSDFFHVWCKMLNRQLCSSSQGGNTQQSQCKSSAKSLLSSSFSCFAAQLAQIMSFHYLLPDLYLHKCTTEPMLPSCNQTLCSHLPDCLCSNNSACAWITEVQKSLECCMGWQTAVNILQGCSLFPYI